MRALFGGAPNNSAPTVGHSPQTPPADPSPAFPLLHGANTAQQPPWWEEVHAQDGEWATLSRSNSAKRRLFGQLGGGDSADEPNGSWAPLSARAARPSTSQIVLAALAGVALLALLSLSPMGGHASAGGIVHGSGGRRYLQAGAPLVAAAAAPAAAGARAAGMAQLREPLWNVSMLLTAGREQAAQLAGEAQQPFLRALVRGASAASGSEIAAAVLLWVHLSPPAADDGGCTISVSMLLPQQASRRLADALAADPLLLRRPAGLGKDTSSSSFNGELRASRVQNKAASCEQQEGADFRLQLLLGCSSATAVA